MKMKKVAWRRVVFTGMFWGAAFSFVFLTTLSEGVCATTTRPSIPQLLERVQHRYTATDFEADFIQEAHLEAMGMTDTAEGHVYFKPPAMMRWHYKVPDEYLIVTNVENVWIHRFEDNQVMVGRAADYFGGRKLAEFFTKPEGLLDDFTIEWAGPELQQKDMHVLRLLPKRKAPNLEEVFLFVSTGTFDIVRSITYNAFGDKTIIRFSGFKFDQGVDVSLFELKIPKGADVVELEAP